MTPTVKRRPVELDTLDVGHGIGKDGIVVSVVFRIKLSTGEILEGQMGVDESRDAGLKLIECSAAIGSVRRSRVRS